MDYKEQLIELCEMIQQGNFDLSDKTKEILSQIKHELLPCPVCGKLSMITTSRGGSYISCVDMSCIKQYTVYEVREEAIEVWNKLKRKNTEVERQREIVIACIKHIVDFSTRLRDSYRRDISDEALDVLTSDIVWAANHLENLFKERTDE